MAHLVADVDRLRILDVVYLLGEDAVLHFSLPPWPGHRILFLLENGLRMVNLGVYCYGEEKRAMNQPGYGACAPHLAGRLPGVTRR